MFHVKQSIHAYWDTVPGLRHPPTRKPKKWHT